MLAASEVIHKHRLDKPPVQRRRPNFEYSFTLAVRIFAGRIVDICCGLVAETMPRRLSRLFHPILVLTTIIVLQAPATAQPLSDEPRAEPVRREILAVYDSREEPRPDQTRIHRFAEMPLNYFGFVVSFWDINAGLPSEERTENVRGIITWLRRPPPPAFYPWAQALV